MLTYASYKPNIGPAIVFGPTSDDYPLKSFEPDQNQDDPSEAQMQAPGEYPTFGYARALVISCEGDILGDNFTDYGSLRQAFLTAFTSPDGTLSARRHGELTLQMSNWSEKAKADVRIVHRRAPIQALYPSVGVYELIFKAWTPWFRGVIQPANLYLVG